MKTILVLWLMAVPAAFQEVPTGCVTLKSAHSHKYLVTASPYDKDRRNVAFFGEKQNWIVNQFGSMNDEYTIMHESLKEYLYTAKYTASGGQKVFTWTPKELVRNGIWQIKRSGNGFSIYNSQYKQCLKAVSDLGSVHTEVQKSCDGDLFKWKMFKC